MTLSNLTKVVSTYALSSILSLFLTPVMILLAKKLNVMDKPNYRKLHKDDTPLLGGLAIYAGFVVSVALFSYHSIWLVKLAVIVGATLIEILALIDDIKNISAKFRLVIMFGLAAAIYITFYFSYFNWNIVHDSIAIAVLLGVLVMVWVSAITNAINFTDGIDGLSSYFSLIALFAFSIILSMQGRYEFALIVNVAAIGGVIGFIPYNRHKALIFMGDAGSMLLGFIISIISLVSTTKAESVLYFVVPIYILLVPLLELATSVMRRMIFKRSIFAADKYHFHHLLNNKINDTLLVVVILTAIQVVLAFAGLIIYMNKWYVQGLIGLVIIIFTVVTLLCIKYKKIKDNELIQSEKNA